MTLHRDYSKSSETYLRRFQTSIMEILCIKGEQPYFHKKALKIQIYV